MKTMKVIAAGLFACALAVSVSACCACRKGKSSVPLYGTEWHLTQLYGQPVEAKGFNMTLTADGHISGLGDCNRFAGSFTLNSKQLKVADNMVVTRMMCRNQERENKFLAMLREVDSYSIDGSRLMLIKGGDVLAIFDPAPKPEPAEAAPADSIAKPTEPEEFRPLGRPILMYDREKAAE